MLAEIGPSPLTLGGVSPEKVVFSQFLAGKLLSIAFSGLRLEAPRKSTRVDSLWLDSGWHPKCLMTTGCYAYIGSSSLGWGQDDESSIYGKYHWTHVFFNFSIVVPIHKKKSRDEITIITETGKTPEE